MRHLVIGIFHNLTCGPHIWHHVLIRLHRSVVAEHRISDVVFHDNVRTVRRYPPMPVARSYAKIIHVQSPRTSSYRIDTWRFVPNGVGRQGAKPG